MMLRVWDARFCEGRQPNCRGDVVVSKSTVNMQVPARALGPLFDLRHLPRIMQRWCRAVSGVMPQ